MSDDITRYIHLARVLMRHKDTFAAIFKMPMTDFWHPLYGFDVIAFDLWLGTPDGEGHSVMSYANAKFGLSAEALLDTIIADENPTPA